MDIGVLVTGFLVAGVATLTCEYWRMRAYAAEREAKQVEAQLHRMANDYYQAVARGAA